MPTLAAVPSQRTTQSTTKRPTKRPNVVNVEAPATVRLHVHPDHQVLSISNQPSNVEYTIYTFHVNIKSSRRSCSLFTLRSAPKLCYALDFNFYLRDSLYIVCAFFFSHFQFFCSINQCAKTTKNKFIFKVVLTQCLSLTVGLCRRTVFFSSFISFLSSSSSSSSSPFLPTKRKSNKSNEGEIYITKATISHYCMNV